MVRYARLKITFPLNGFRAEIDSIRQKWITHFNYTQFEGEWSALSLRCPGGKWDQIIPDQVSSKDYSDTELLLACPAIKNWLSDFQCKLFSVRLLNLRSGSVIKEHRDYELCYENGEARLHFPILTNEQVEFYVNNERVIMNEGECWYINANLPHRVANKGTRDRIHLVVDCDVNDWIRAIFDKGECFFAEERKMDDTLKIIHELRLQNTATSNQLAEQLEKQLHDSA